MLEFVQQVLANLTSKVAWNFLRRKSRTRAPQEKTEGTNNTNFPNHEIKPETDGNAQFREERRRQLKAKLESKVQERLRKEIKKRQREWDEMTPEDRYRAEQMCGKPESQTEATWLHNCPMPYSAEAQRLFDRHNLEDIQTAWARLIATAEKQSLIIGEDEFDRPITLEIEFGRSGTNPTEGATIWTLTGINIGQSDTGKLEIPHLRDKVDSIKLRNLAPLLKLIEEIREKTKARRNSEDTVK